MENEFNYNTKSEALKAVKKNGSNLKLCTPEFQNNEDVVMTAIKKYSWSFEYASDTLKNNKDFIEPCGKPPRSRGGWIAILNPNNT